MQKPRKPAEPLKTIRYYPTERISFDHAISLTEIIGLVNCPPEEIVIELDHYCSSSYSECDLVIKGLPIDIVDPDYEAKMTQYRKKMALYERRLQKYKDWLQTQLSGLP